MLHSFAERPKKRRHRCKDPTKLDVKSLTGEERVPVVHRNTGRRVRIIHSCTLKKKNVYKQYEITQISDALFSIL